MLFLIEIILTIFAWRKGWKWLALIPLGIAVLVGFLIGFSTAMSGADLDALTSGIVVLDIAAIVALIVMIVKGPKLKEFTPKSDD